MKPISPFTHLNWETIQAYLAGTLNRSEIHAVEEHLLDCALCADAVEGLSQTKPTQTDQMIRKTEQQIDKKIQKKKKRGTLKIFYPYWAIAASLVLVLGIVLVLLVKMSVKKENLAEASALRNEKIAEGGSSSPANEEQKSPESEKLDEKRLSKPAEKRILEKKDLKADKAETQEEKIAESLDDAQPLQAAQEETQTADRVAAEVQKRENETTPLPTPVVEDAVKESPKDEELAKSAPVVASNKKQEKSKRSKAEAADRVDTVSVMPENGWQKFQEYVKKHLQYPEDAKRDQLKGTVVLEILVGTNNEVKNVLIKSGLSETCNAEAVRIVKSYKWLAARRKGKTTEERTTVKILFE